MTSALVFADRDGNALLPLTEDCGLALLPVAGIPLIQHTFDDLAAGGIEQAIVASPYASELERALGGAHDAIELAFERLTGPRAAMDLIDRVARHWGGEFLVVQGDVLRAPVVPWFLATALGVRGNCHLRIDHKPAGVVLVRSTAAWAHRRTVDTSWQNEGRRLEAAGGRFWSIHALSDYYDANLAAAAGEIEGLLLGTPIAPGVHVGRHASVPLEGLAQPPVLVGANCHVHPTAALGPHVVLASGVIVDRDARLDHAVVLPGTHVPERAALSRVIVAPRAIVDMTSGSLDRPRVTMTAERVSQPEIHDAVDDLINRIGGALLIVLALPLWILMAVVAMLTHPRHPFERVRLRGNRLARAGDGDWQFAEVEVWTAAVGAPILRYLPYLAGVLRGHFRLVGVRPLTEADEARYPDEWRWTRREAPVGLVGPGQLATIGLGEIGEDVFLVERRYAQTRTPRADAYWLLRAALAIVSPRAWRRPVAPSVAEPPRQRAA
ncbi:MAG: hypothetical protein U0Q12_15695 [Vicinamibacterales bacterium]